MNETQRINRIAEWYKNTIARYRDKHYHLIAQDTNFLYEEVRTLGEDSGMNLTDLRTVFETAEHVIQNT